MKRRFLALAMATAAFGPVQALDQQPPVRTATEAFDLVGKTARVESGRKFFGDARYSGSESCKVCHESQYQSWAASWHSKMERWPNAATVVGDFDNRTIRFRNLRVRGADGKEGTISPTALAFRQGERFFFTLIDKDDAANNQTWEVAKVLGGKWDQGYEVRIGEDNYYPAPIRWSVTQKDWIIGGFNPQDWFLADGTPDGRPFKRTEMPMIRVAEAKCNGCHTTGFVYAKDSSGVWKARTHGQGEIGIACESCHGPGSRHVDEAHAAKKSGQKLQASRTAIVNPLTDLNAEQATQVCGQCHGRGSHKELADLSFPTGFLPGDTDLKARYRLWSYSGTSSKAESEYFWPNDWAARNRQQYQDFTKSGHYNKAGMSCITCHAFHGKTETAQLRAKPEHLCVECHRATGRALRPDAEMFAGSDKDQIGMTCVDCHMQRIGSRSRATEVSGHQWDATSHVFAVASPRLEETLGVRTGCTTCHSNDRPTKVSGRSMAAGVADRRWADEWSRRAKEVRAEVTAIEALLLRVDTRNVHAMALAERARTALQPILLGLGAAAHNIRRTREALGAARMLADEAVSAVGSRANP